MAIDGLSHDPDEIPKPVRPADNPPARPSLDRAPENIGQPPRASTLDKDPEKAELTRAIAIGGAGLPWIRKLREGRDDRPED